MTTIAVPAIKESKAQVSLVLPPEQTRTIVGGQWEGDLLDARDMCDGPWLDIMGAGLGLAVGFATANPWLGAGAAFGWSRWVSTVCRS